MKNFGLEFKKTDDIRAKVVNIDLCHLNPVEAVKFAIRYTTENFLKEPNKKICIILRDIETKKMIEALKLKNTVLQVRKEIK